MQTLSNIVKQLRRRCDVMAISTNHNEDCQFEVSFSENAKAISESLSSYQC